MNKLLLNKNGRNHIRVYPLNDTIEFPEDKAEKINLCEKLFNDLQHDESAIRHYYYRNVKTGIQVTVFESNNKIYLTNCFRVPEHTYVTTIYINKLDSLEDCINIAKFLSKNMNTIGNDYKQQIIDGQEAYDDYVKEIEAKA